MGAVVSRIPICGGFCAATESPDGCHGRFSNEKTLPGPCLQPFCMRTCLEHSLCCRAFGRVGCDCASKARRPLMLFAFACSFVSWLMMLLSSLAIAESESLLKGFPWATATLQGPLRTLDVRIGIRAVLGLVHSGDAATVSTVQPWDLVACGEWLGLEDACESCRSVATSCTSFIIISLVTQIVQITTDLQRSTAYGDVNCQKLMGFSTSVFGCVSGLISLSQFASSCWRNLPSTLLVGGVSTEASWKFGIGFVLILLAVVAKAFDAACHLALPTPSARHAPVSEPIALADYMKQAAQPAANRQQSMLPEYADSHL